jgi:transposase
LKKIVIRFNYIYDIIKRHKKRHIIYKFDVLLERHGYNILRLPPYHPDLNPIEKIWASVKNSVAKKNVTFKLDNAKILAEHEFSNTKFNTIWKNVCSGVITNEDNYLLNERRGVRVPEIIINLGADSDFEFFD